MANRWTCTNNCVPHDVVVMGDPRMKMVVLYITGHNRSRVLLSLVKKPPKRM